MTDETTEPQPWFPKIRLLWLFALISFAALLMFLVRSADQRGELVFALIYSVIFVVVFFAFLSLFYGMSFLVAYSLGKFERKLSDSTVVVSSPFADGQLPDQIVPPRPSEHI